MTTPDVGYYTTIYLLACVYHSMATTAYFLTGAETWSYLFHGWLSAVSYEDTLTVGASTSEDLNYHLVDTTKADTYTLGQLRYVSLTDQVHVL